MQIKDVYSQTFIQNINRLFQRTIIDPNLPFDQAIPVEIFMQNLGYQIQKQSQLKPMQIEPNKHIITVNSQLSTEKQRFYLGNAFGKLVYIAQTKAFLNQSPRRY